MHPSALWIALAGACLFHTGQAQACGAELAMNIQDFTYKINQQVTQDILLECTLPMNRAYIFVSIHPLEVIQTLTQNFANGPMCRLQHQAGSTDCLVDASAADLCTCTETAGCELLASLNQYEAQAKFTYRFTMREVVAALNIDGVLTIYNHRAWANPMASRQDTQWLASDAVELGIPVTFECDGGPQCITVNTIVCAHFAGIDANSHGVQTVECKVPPAMVSSKWWYDTEFPGTSNTPLANTYDYNAGSAARWIFRSASPIVDDSVIEGITVVSGDVCGTMPAATICDTSDPQVCVRPDTNRGLSVVPNCAFQEIHRAPYNLSLASRLISDLKMPSNCYFMSALPPAAGTAASWIPSFPTSSGDDVYLLRQEIEYGQITPYDKADAYLKFTTNFGTTDVFINNGVPTGYHFDFSSVTWIRNTAGVETLGSASDCVPMFASRGREYTTGGDLVAYVRCAGILAQVNAGDTMYFSIKYRIKAGIAPTASLSGKAAVQQSNVDDMRSVSEAETSLEVTIVFEGNGDSKITIGKVKKAQKAAGLWKGHVMVMVGSIFSALVIMLGVGACGYIHMHAKRQARGPAGDPNDEFIAVSPAHKPPHKTVSAMHPASAPVIATPQWSELEDV